MKTILEDLEEQMARVRESLQSGQSRLEIVEEVEQLLYEALDWIEDVKVREMEAENGQI